MLKDKIISMRKLFLIALFLIAVPLFVTAQVTQDSVTLTEITTTDFMQSKTSGVVNWLTARPKRIRCPKDVGGNGDDGCGSWFGGIIDLIGSLLSNLVDDGLQPYTGTIYIGSLGGGFWGGNGGPPAPPSLGGGSAPASGPFVTVVTPPPVNPIDVMGFALGKKDCAGVTNGTAYKDYCDSCVGGTTMDTIPCCPTDSTFSLTKTVLKNMYSGMHSSRADSIAKYINQYGKDYGINTRLRLAHFLAQIITETSGFYTLTEDWSYKSKDRLLEIFKDRKKINDSNYHYYLQCQCLFNMYYAGDGKNHTNGDSTTGDGFKYRGRGAIQLTHRDSYYYFTKYYQNKYNDTSVDFEANPDLVVTNWKYFVLSALWEFGVDKSRTGTKYHALKDSDADNVKKVTKVINGGYNALKERTENLAIIKKILCL